ncbi:MAG: AEC family transporter [Pseudomonadota bacterium]
MLLSLTIIAPIFGLILIGYASGRFGILSEATGQGVADFTFILAIPALLFRTIVKADFSQSDFLGVWGSFFLAAGATWVLASLLTTTLLARPTRDAPAISMSSAFGNTVMLGLPLAVATFGDIATPTIALVLAIHAPTFWLTATIQQTFSEDTPSAEREPVAQALFRELGHNPIVLGISAGLIWRLTGVPLEGPIDEIVRLLAQAGIPAALIALGLSLTKFQIAGQLPTLMTINALKLAVMPLIAWSLATYVFQLPPLTTGVVTILAAMPTGANAYLFAVRHNAAPASSSGAVALGTVLTVLTASAIITLLGSAS